MIRRAALLVAAASLALGLAPIAAGSAAAATSGTAVITTEPALAGVTLAVEGRTVVTGADGTVSVPVGDVDAVRRTIALRSTTWGARNTIEQAFVRQLPRTAPKETRVVVGIDMTSRVRVAVDAGSTGVKPVDVTRMRLHSSSGDDLTIDPRTDRSIPLLSRVARQPNGTTTTEPVTWTVSSVTAEGATVGAVRTPFDPFTDSTWTIELRRLAGTVVVETVPATQGVEFTIDGSTLVTGADGSAVAPVEDLDAVEDRLALAAPADGARSVSVVALSRATPREAFQRRVVAALAVTEPVKLAFTDLAGRPVDAARVGAVRLSGGGGTVDLSAGQLEAAPLVTTKARRIDGTWVARPVSYSVTSVDLDGSNAVFSGQQRFVPSAGEPVVVTLSLFDVDVTFRDALLGTEVTAPVELTLPDGTVQPVPSEGGTALQGLVRGEYVLDNSAAVVGSRTRMLVSRSTEVELKVITLLDVVVVVSLMLALCLALVWLGRALKARSAARQAGPEA